MNRKLRLLNTQTPFTEAKPNIVRARRLGMGSDLCFTRAKGSMKDSGLTIEDTEWATRNTKMEI